MSVRSKPIKVRQCRQSVHVPEREGNHVRVHDKGKITASRRVVEPLIPAPNLGTGSDLYDKGHTHSHGQGDAIARIHVGKGHHANITGAGGNTEEVETATTENRQCFTTNSGKHSVEINVKIRKNNSSEHSSVHNSPNSGQKASPTPIPNICHLKRGSWAELLHRPSVAQLNHPLPHHAGGGGDAQVHVLEKPKQKESRKSRDRHRTRARHVSPIPMSKTTGTGIGEGDVRNTQNDIVEDYAKTIEELYQLCTQLKKELTDVHNSKEELVHKLQEVIYENEKLQATSTKSVAQLIETVKTITKERDELKAKNQEISKDLAEHNAILNGILNAVTDVKKAVNIEIGALKDEMAKEPFPTMKSFKSRFLSDARNNKNANLSGSSLNLFSSSDESSTMSEASFYDRDQSSTQYLNLPKETPNAGS